MRPKHEYPFYPCMWFEIQPGAYSYGVGHFESTPDFMEFFRKAISKKTRTVSEAVRSAEKVGQCFPKVDIKKRKKQTFRMI